MELCNKHLLNRPEIRTDQFSLQFVQNVEGGWGGGGGGGMAPIRNRRACSKSRLGMQITDFRLT